MLAAAPAAAAERVEAFLDKAVEYRNLGPYRAGARVSDFAVPDPAAPRQ